MLLLLFLIVSATPPPSVVSQQRPQQVPQYDYSTLPAQYDESTARFQYFDWELLRDLNTNDNVLISPASIKSTLAMVLEGAFGNTAKEIVNALRLPKDETRRKQVLLQLISSLSDSDQNTTLESSNAVFVSKNYEIIPEYKSKLEYYKAILEQLNFDNPTQAANTINSFIKKATGGLIPEIVTPSHLDPDTAVVITNALYFKAAWKHEFDDSKIKCFYPQGKDCIYTYMMQMIATVNYRQLEEIHGHAVELPYGDNKHAMLILVPSEKNNFKHFVNDVRLQSLARILNRLEQTEIMLELPKFEINYSIDLVDTLKQHDIRDAFDSYANLSGIVYDKKVKISSIIHKTKIIVNEKGTIAAAASGVLVTPLMGSTMPRVIVDHPFLFFIYKIQTRDILFEGILNKPTEAMNTATRTNSNPIQLTNRNTYVSPTQQQQQLINNVRLLQQQPLQNQYQFQ